MIQLSAEAVRELKTEKEKSRCNNCKTITTKIAFTKNLFFQLFFMTFEDIFFNFI